MFKHIQLIIEQLSEAQHYHVLCSGNRRSCLITRGGQVLKLLFLKVYQPQFNCNYFAMASNEDTYQLLIVVNC